jgi:hypothetical protein
VQDCADAAVLRQLAQAGATFAAHALADVEALSRAHVPPAAALMHVHGLRIKHVRRAAALGVRRFAAASCAEVAMLRQFAPEAEVLAVLSADGTGAGLCMDAFAEALAQGAQMAGLLLRWRCPSAAARAAEMLHSAAATAEGAGRALLHVQIDAPSDKAASDMVAVVRGCSPLRGAKVVVAARSLLDGVLTLVSQVHSVAGGSVFVADMPHCSAPASCSVEVLAAGGGACSTDAEATVRGAPVTVTDGAASADMALPQPLRAGDWLLWRSCLQWDVAGAFCTSERFYVDW